MNLNPCFHAPGSTRRRQSGGGNMNRRGSSILLRFQNALLCLSGLFILTTALVVSLVPIVIVVSLWWHIAERRFMWRLQRSRRRQPWAEIRTNMANRQGTLVLEADREWGEIHRVWWVREHLLKLFPLAPWTCLEEIKRLSSDREPIYVPRATCREWCEHFLPTFADAAVLTSVSPGLIWSYLNGPTCAAHAIAVVPFPALTYCVKRAK